MMKPFLSIDLLSTSESREADRATIAAGTPGIELMENAGAKTAQIIQRYYDPRPVLVACGGGNNGGDGYVVARLLKEAGWQVTVAMVGAKESAIRGDAATALAGWKEAGGEVIHFENATLKGKELIVDAIFGVGLNRQPEGDAAAAISGINKAGVPVIAVDVPSGVDADSGAVPGVAVRAAHTVTFFRAKPGLWLYPGRAHVGRLHVVDIGIGSEVLERPRRRCWQNDPELWRDELPQPSPEAHKYARGHAIVSGGPVNCTGAARLAAIAALRAGAGAVSVACNTEALSTYAATLTAVMTKPITGEHDFPDLLADGRVRASLVGPGAGIGQEGYDRTHAVIRSGKPCVLDADALTLMSMERNSLFYRLHASCVLTPHEGEFTRLFGERPGTRLERAREAAAECGAIVVFKGPDTVIASPEGHAAINTNAPATLATAGSGDVLAGIICGLLAQGMPTFFAAAAGVWIHGAAANLFGPGLIAEDLPDMMPEVLRGLYI